MRRSSRGRKQALVLVTAVLAGCASPPAPQAEPERRREHSALAHQRAGEALARGDHDGALRYYQSALERNRAVENQDAVATALLNVAATQHRRGDFAAARASLLELIGHNPPFATGYVGRAEARLALVELQLDRPDEAARHAARAIELCADAQCPWRLALLGVLARIALEAGDLDAATVRATEARAAAAKAGDRQEEANSLRVLGEAAARGGRSDAARAAFSAALGIDKEIEAPGRIALDLLALARLELAQGDRAAARSYARRAAAVSEVAKLPGLLAEARALLREAE